jgi:hypothetical protein
MVKRIYNHSDELTDAQLIGATLVETLPNQEGVCTADNKRPRYKVVDGEVTVVCEEFEPNPP